MSYCIRLMRKADIPQVVEIDREAFPTIGPPVNYQHELQNRLAHYIVVGKAIDETVANTIPPKNRSGLMSRVRHLFSHGRFFSPKAPQPGSHYIIGFAGFWIMADESHITNIAVRETYQHQGIGELSLISIIDLTTELDARNITLEVRASNAAAISLYRKYGFTQVGLRRGYYTDNKEDAILMSTEDITSASFQKHLQQLKEAHSRKWGIPLYEIGR